MGINDQLMHERRNEITGNRIRELEAEVAALRKLLVAVRYPCTCAIRPSCDRCKNVDAVMRQVSAL